MQPPSNSSGVFDTSLRNGREASPAPRLSGLVNDSDGALTAVQGIFENRTSCDWLICRCRTHSFSMRVGGGLTIPKLLSDHPFLRNRQWRRKLRTTCTSLCWREEADLDIGMVLTHKNNLLTFATNT